MDMVKINKPKANNSPDVALESKPDVAGHIDWVGMENVVCPVRLPHTLEGAFIVPAKVDLGVSLDKPSARGIHMSRLFGRAQDFLLQEPLTPKRMKMLVSELIVSQDGLSESARLKVAWEQLLLRKALVSEEKGWKSYPLYFEAVQKKDSVEVKMGLELYYSSTCPCSAALSQQALVEEFVDDFSHLQNISVGEAVEWLKLKGVKVATPHAQRSKATVEVSLREGEFHPGFDHLIDSIEEVLGTPVQAAVKRRDEQEFARRNAQNLMFCEDAVRRIKNLLEHQTCFVDFTVKVEHQESLHAHNAVARASKGE